MDSPPEAIVHLEEEALLPPLERIAPLEGTSPLEETPLREENVLGPPLVAVEPLLREATRRHGWHGL